MKVTMLSSMFDIIDLEGLRTGDEVAPGAKLQTQNHTLLSLPLSKVKFFLDGMTVFSSPQQNRFIAS